MKFFNCLVQLLKFQLDMSKKGQYLINYSQFNTNPNLLYIQLRFYGTFRTFSFLPTFAIIYIFSISLSLLFILFRSIFTKLFCQFLCFCYLKYRFRIFISSQAPKIIFNKLFHLFISHFIYIQTLSLLQYFNLRFQRMKGVIKEVGQFTVGQAIGEGSFGKVFKGLDRINKIEVALKFISKRGKNKKQLEGLRTQNQMLKKISHKNIIKLLDFLQTPTEMIIITQFAGENLSDVLERKKKFTFEEVKSCCTQIFDALCYLDQNRIAHRDLKPQNILLQNQVIKICDFGFARKLSASTNFMNSLKGTPLYIAPEILGIGPLNYTKKVDVWSFGIIMFQLFAGRPPFYAQTLPKLKPKILCQKVRFPKEMPIQLRSLIDKMLQKNPDNRADWEELKKFQFFSPITPLKQISSKFQNVEIQKQEYIKVDDPILTKLQSEKEPIPIPQKHTKLNRLNSNQDIQQIKTIESDLLSQKIQAKKLRQDSNFYERVMQIYSSYFTGEGVVPKHMLNHITSIFIYLLSKVKPNQIDSVQDITRKKQLLFCAIKLIEQDTEPESITSELMLIGFLIKNNFDNVSIDFQTDQDIIEICLRQVQAYRSHLCFANALTVLGTLASQGIITVNNSQEFFIKIQQQKVLATIAESFEPIPSKRIVLQCLEKFIHPNQFCASITKNQQLLKKAFLNMKIQVAGVLINKNYLLHNPLSVYKEVSHVESYAKILYECICVSQAFRREMLKGNFWTEFLNFKNLRIFCFAYDYVCIQKDKTCLIPNEVMKGVATAENSKKNSLMENAFYLARAEFYLSKKQTQTSNKQQSTLKLLNEVCQSVSVDEELKKKASREIEGFLFYGQRVFQEVLANTYCNIMNDPMFDKSSLNQNIIQCILENILNVKHQEELRISSLTAAKILIATEQILHLEQSKLKQNKKIFSVIAHLIFFLVENGLIYQIQAEQGPAFTKKLLFSIFIFLKMYSSIDEKQQTELYCKIEEKGIHNLLVSDSIICKNSLSICLTILQKLVCMDKYVNSVIDFIGITLMDKFKNYLRLDLQDKDSEIVTQILHLISLVIKKSEQYAGKIKQLDIISHFPRYIQHPNNQGLRHQTLTLIGNMAKHSPYFFDQFATHATFPSIVDTIKRYGLGSKNKLLKGIIYAIGNVSYYTDRFAKDFIQLIPHLYTALTIDDQYLVANTMSTISNLLRHSNCYLKSLIQNKIIKKVIQIIMQSSKPDNKLMFALNMIKKALAYPQIFEDHPKSQFIAIYTQKVKLVTEDNECMKKIKTFI